MTALRSAGPVLVAILCFGLAQGQDAASPLSDLTKTYDGLDGQLQVGGPFVGLEFHHSRPVPSRISFYYPVANSIDLSTDYWERDQSMPLSLYLAVDGRHEDLSLASLPYKWTPANVEYAGVAPTHKVKVSYRFGETLPIMVMQVEVTNVSDNPLDVMLSTDLETTLRTSHAYTWRDTASVSYSADGLAYRADFDAADTDSATVFVVNAGMAPESTGDRTGVVKSPSAEFVYSETLAPGYTFQVIQIIGSSRRQQVADIVRRARVHWRDDVTAFEQRVADFVDATTFSVDDPAIVETARWSKAIQQANRHPLEGHIVPMPCPAQYNFFFTHDLLLTDRGVVQFDPKLVGNDLRYLLHFDKGDHVLTHARYWRDGKYVSEMAGSDNWNHLWFILLTGSYLRHSADTALVAHLYPMVSKSLALMLENYKDGIMQGSEPDWWDIGDVYGPKAYLTILTIRAIRTFGFLTTALNREEPRLSEYIALADQLQEHLVAQLWDDEAGFLLSELDNGEVDHHLYMGSLLAAVFDQIDDDKKQRMLETARTELLDSEIGLRTVVPTDFDKQIERYRFVGLEAGLPGRYINGGVWPHGNAWYAMALLSSNQPDSALAAVRKFYTLDGIADSPGGQPALYEYRRTDKDSPAYGELDKTTFLWAGGWYLSTLYQLGGVRENEWNVRFDANLPQGFEDASYDVTIAGHSAHVQWSGSGPYFEQISADGRSLYSAVLTTPASQIDLVRGRPDTPYLERADAIVEGVSYDAKRRSLDIDLRGPSDGTVTVQVVSPSESRRVKASGAGVAILGKSNSDLGDGIHRTTVRTSLGNGSARVTIEFRK